MAYRNAKADQILYYARNVWEERELVKVLKVYTAPKANLHPNCAVIMTGESFTFPVHVELKDLYLKPE
jgi:hypothetical protein